MECILCAIVSGDPRVESMKLFETELSMVVMNLYPYNPGHIMIFPKRHVAEIGKMTLKEWDETFLLVKKSLGIIKDLYKCGSFNIGWNIGKDSGASLKHVHLHIVPRYRNEIGFVDILSGTKIIIEDPGKSFKRLSAAFKERR